MIGAPAAHSAYADTATFVIIENENGNCLDVPNNTPVMEPCSSALTQVWKKVNVPNHPNVFLIRSASSNGDCLDVSGAQGVMGECKFDGSRAFQLWHEENGVSQGFHQLANDGDGTDQVIHPSGCSAAAGVELFMNERNICQADDWFPF
jgi:hypothetical protein